MRGNNKICDQKWRSLSPPSVIHQPGGDVIKVQRSTSLQEEMTLTQRGNWKAQISQRSRSLLVDVVHWDGLGLPLVRALYLPPSSSLRPFICYL